LVQLFQIEPERNRAAVQPLVLPKEKLLKLVGHGLNLKQKCEKYAYVFFAPTDFCRRRRRHGLNYDK